MINVGIIGTAGRKDDAPKITAALFDKMIEKTDAFIRRFGAPDSVNLVSGAAAVADSVAVSLFLRGEYASLTLHLPATFVAEDAMFNQSVRGQEPGNVANYYHYKFSEIIGRSSMAEISRAIYKGAKLTISRGFFERNSLVAQSSQVLLAMTFGNGAQVKEGGAADTVKKQKKIHIDGAYHLDLHTCDEFRPAILI